ncbi:MAG: hypothetical protein K0S53_2002 [Bacteroidetes bacterium]|jgi:hypothetical protein|nr:hypothetical protein [Bacteroidota bacterium]MDF2451068.1 hypothetical protein [Bacteroidota bacterium]
MKFLFSVTTLSLLSFPLVSQNDIDAIRYSQTFFGGTSRSKAMAGSFGALGADGSCMANNPAGIGLYRKGDINLSLGLKFFSVEAIHNGTSNKNFKASVPFDGLTIVGAWDSKLQPDNHHSLGLSCNQIVNFNSNTTIEGKANFKSIANDFLSSANGKALNNLDNSYSGMAYDNYLIDRYDTTTNQYATLINTKYDLIQSKEIETRGKINEWCFSYAYGYKDKLYLGATLGIPIISFSHNSVYSETDVNDSMRLSTNSNPTYYYPTEGVGGFKSMSYQETYKTTGTGYNLKVGIIYRAAEFIRLGASFHSPTIYNLSDGYVYKMNANYDEGGSFTTQYPPDNGGKFNYQVITPMKFIGSIALLYQKLGVINIDYDIINYKQASLQSSPQEFTGVNAVIRNKYSQTSNLRVGAEANLKPMFVRLGYAMYGSPFGETFTGDFVKSFYTGGIGFRKEKMYLDISFTKSMNSENYYMYNPKFVDKTTLKNSGTTIAVTVGSKF